MVASDEHGKGEHSWLHAVAGYWVIAGIWAILMEKHAHRPDVTTAAPSRFLERARETNAVAKVVFDASSLQHMDHLILVPGHAVLDPHAESLDSADQKESVWQLLDYQRNQHLPQVLVSHIQRGVQEAARDSKSVLVFSGGQTRPDAGPHDEASSYLRIAEHYDWWGHASSVQGSNLSVAHRTLTEEFATDSFQNLLFSICRFREVVGAYPKRITVVGFSFKADRFVSYHRSAIRFPLENFSYIGMNPDRMLFDLEQAEIGEKKNSLAFFQVDPYGCNSSQLLAKRSARNPFRRTSPYPLSCPDLRGLLEWCKVELYAFALPWNTTTMYA